jgi:hypothetical protein
MRMHNKPNKQIQIRKQTHEKSFSSKKVLENCSKPCDYVFTYTRTVQKQGYKKWMLKETKRNQQNQQTNINISIYMSAFIVHYPFGRISCFFKKKPTLWFFFSFFRSFCLISGQFNRNSKATKCLQRTKHRYQGLAYKLYVRNLALLISIPMLTEVI